MFCAKKVTKLPDLTVVTVEVLFKNHEHPEKKLISGIKRANNIGSYTTYTVQVIKHKNKKLCMLAIEQDIFYLANS
jgi:hypothetical protein